MKKVAVTVAGPRRSAWLRASRRLKTMPRQRDGGRNNAETDINAAANDATAVADNALNAADNAVNSAGNAVDNASNAVGNSP